MLEQQRDYVLRSVEERGVRLIRLWFTDVLGNLKSLAISPAELDNALSDGIKRSKPFKRKSPIKMKKSKRCGRTT